MLTQILAIASCLPPGGSAALEAGEVSALAESGSAHVGSTGRSMLAGRCAASFDEPSSSSFLALGEADREAVQRFFTTGPGAVPEDGTLDAVADTWRRDRVPGYPGLFHITIGNTGSGYTEKFLLQMPDFPPAGERPLLVVFHKNGVSHLDALAHTDFIAEARARDWYLIAPLGATQHNFGSLPSQVNVRVAIDLVVSSLPVDRTRIYGVGFSMGGGGCASYAARHLDPAGAMFAAVVNHTGTVSLAHAYGNEGAEVRQILEAWFGGPPWSQPFAYRRCSTIDLDPTTNAVGTGTDMARNLRDVGVHDWLASNDPHSYLPLQTQAFHAHIQAMNPAAVLTIANGDVHDWSTLDETAVCNWLAPRTLPTLTSGTTLADEDGVWHRFFVEQDAPGAFTPFEWHVYASQNRLDLSNTGNLSRLTVDTVPLGLVDAGSLRLNLSTGDATGDQVLLLDVMYAPNAVFRNGVPASGTYDGLAHTFLVSELSGAPAQWVIVF